MTDEERAALEAIENSYDDLDRWNIRLAAVHVPGRGSPMQHDDAGWPPMPVSQVARAGLIAAKDHLMAVRRLIEVKQLFPSAQLTMIRAGLIGAAQAVWVLGPADTADRQQRGFMVAAYEYGRHAAWLKEVRQLVDPNDVAQVDQVAAFVAGRADELRSNRLASGDRASLDTTAMIRDAAMTSFAHPRTRVEVMAIWRAISGDAHGLGWQRLGRPGDWSTEVGSPVLSQFSSGGDLMTIAEAYTCVYQIAVVGWRLFDERANPAT